MNYYQQPNFQYPTPPDNMAGLPQFTAPPPYFPPYPQFETPYKQEAVKPE